MINLHKLNCMDDNILKHTVGITIKNGIYTKVKGTLAKNVQWNDPAYANPLFKTYKLENSKINKTRIFYIPVRLVQSAGKITTTKVTSFLEIIFEPISTNFCKYKVNEYSKDSKTYLEKLANWKNNLNNSTNRNKTLYLVAADVQGLYPNLCRELVKASISGVLRECTEYTKEIR